MDAGYRRPELLRPHLQSRLTPRTTTGARCSAAIRPPGRSSTPFDTYRNLATHDDVRRRLPARLEPAASDPAARRRLVRRLGRRVRASRRRASVLRSSSPARSAASPARIPNGSGSSDLRYAWRDLEVGLALALRRLDGRQSRFFKTIDVTIPHKDYFDLDAGYTIDDGWFDGLTIRAGVENLTDEPPPIIPTWVECEHRPVAVRRARATLLRDIGAALLTARDRASNRRPLSLLTLPSVGIA